MQAQGKGKKGGEPEKSFRPEAASGTREDMAEKDVRRAMEKI